MEAFAGKVAYAMLQKIYGRSTEAERRYSPSRLLGVIQEKKCGKPDMRHVSTSYVERQNLTTRMSMRRFTRLTNAFSKNVENLAHAVALHFMYYNYCRVHQTLGVTPAMAVGVADRVWTLENVLQLLDSN